MTTTLLLRLAGPMQSWGIQSRFGDRDTGRDPSKSGVIGLLCAALGRPREMPLDDLVALHMGVRVDQPGIPRVDYQTAGGTHLRGDRYGVAKASGATPGTVVSTRHYLADASFLVGLEGDEPLLRDIAAALLAPVWPLSLGRKSYVPSSPVYPPDGISMDELVDQSDRPLVNNLLLFGLRPEGLIEAFRRYTWPKYERVREQQRLRVVRDALPSEDNDVRDVRHDVPLSFALGNRQFGPRYVVTEWIDPWEEMK